MLIKVLECVLSKTHALLIRILLLLLDELFTRWPFLLVIKSDFRSLPLEICNLGLVSTVLTVLRWAEFGIVANWLNICLIISLRLLLSVHSRVISRLWPLSVHWLLFTQLAFSVHWNIPVWLLDGWLFCSGAGGFDVGRWVCNYWEETITLIVKTRLT